MNVIDFDSLDHKSIFEKLKLPREPKGIFLMVAGCRLTDGKPNQNIKKSMMQGLELSYVDAFTTRSMASETV